ncbi:MAG: InlB B-repeat-containing protein, partial [Oscillospiraceae bacterium]|nr:InlB B-repeat-containing protein [Oscillospiraceae bacterium]
MKNESVKRCAVVIMTFVMLMSLVAPIRFWAMGYDPINMDLNDPNDPIQDTCWIQRDQTAYIFNTMRPIIADTQKYVYTDPSYKEQYLLTGTEYPVAPEAEITLWVKFVQVLWNGDTQSKYYYVIVHGPPSSDVVYMESLAGEEIHPMYGDGTFADPYKATIYVSVSKTDIARNDIVRSSTSGVGYIFTSGDFQYFTESVELEIGDNHVYIVILNSDGYIAICYDITVIRRPVKYLLTYYANSGTSANKEVEVFKDERYEVAGNSFTPPTGYAFSGWNTAADGNGDDYAPGEEITINSNLELYAQWTPIVPSAPIVSMEKADSVLYLLWHNVGAGGVDSYKVKYYETADITTAVERVIPLSALTINNSEISYHMFSGLKNDVE